MEKRDRAWLEARVAYLIANHFRDMGKGYPIVLEFGSRSRRCLGSIAVRNGRSVIRINQLFSDPEVPQYVVDETLAHELVHYLHGFASGLPRQHENPHQGGVVERELEMRGLGEVHRKAKVWRNAHWEAFYNSRCSDLLEGRNRRKQSTTDKWEAFLSNPRHRTANDLQRAFQRMKGALQMEDSLAVQEVQWLYAPTHQKAMSYYYPNSKVVKVHGLLADIRVPQEVVAFEIAYWLVCLHHVTGLERIHSFLAQYGLDESMLEALEWRKRHWERFRIHNHPMINKK